MLPDDMEYRKVSMRARQSVIQHPDFPQLRLPELIQAFENLPHAPNAKERSASVWTLHLQYPYSHYITGDVDELELTFERQGMLRPATVPIKRSLLQKGNEFPYLFSVVLDAFTARSENLLQWDISDYEELGGAAAEGTAGEMGRSKGAITYPLAGTAGIKATPNIGLHGRKATPTKRKLFQPTQISIRDSRLYEILVLGFSALMHHCNIYIHIYSGTGTDFTDPSGKDRRDVTMCALHTCSALSTTHARCARCRLGYYCSSEHQREDWAKHKQTCIMMKKEAEAG